jgi:hypothetical protein
LHLASVSIAPIAFPTKRRIIRKQLNSELFPELEELETWARNIGIKIGPVANTLEKRLKALQLVYFYRHLNGTGLDLLEPTDLAIHRVNMVPGLKPSSAKTQKRWPPDKEWWMKKLIQEGLDGGVFEKTLIANGKLSEWNARIVLVDKVENPGPQDEPRLAFNYSQVKENIPGSRMELASTVHDNLSNPEHRCFFHADIKHAYFSVLLAPEDRHYFAFTVPGFGQLQPTRMPQGSGTASFTMTELMLIVLGAIPPPNPEPSLLTMKDPAPVVSFVDDLYGGAESFENMYQFLRGHFFPRIEWAGLRLSFKKLALFVTEVDALGIHHEVGGHMSIKENRIQKIVEYPPPTNQTEVRAFLGVLGITMRWIKNFGELSRPLRRLTGNVPFRWGKSEQLSFEILRIKCASNTRMCGINPKLPVRFYFDASKYAGGLLITQMQPLDTFPLKGIPEGVQCPVGFKLNLGKVDIKAGEIWEAPILYDSKTFSKPERNYGAYKRELAIMVHFARKHSHLIRNPNLPAEFFTDHKPLENFLHSENLDGIYARWASQLWPLSFQIKHIPGERNVVADGLSRTLFSREDCLPDDEVERTSEELRKQGPKWIWKDGKGGFDWWLKTLTEQEKKEVEEKGTLYSLPVHHLEATASWDLDYRSSQWFADQYLSHKTGRYEALSPSKMRTTLDYRIEEGRLWRTVKGETLMCIPESKVALILKQAHDESGHWGKEGTLSKLKGKAYWPGKSTDVERYLAGCIHCIRHSPAQHSQWLQPVIVEEPFQMLGMDWIGPLPQTSSGNRYILHVMDYLSEFSFTRASKGATVEETIRGLDSIFHRLTHPRIIYCDRGQHFEAEKLKDYLNNQGVQLVLGPSGSSKSFGLIERGNRILEDVIRKRENPWDEGLPEITRLVNHRVISHLKYSPVEILMGVKPQVIPALTSLIPEREAWETWSNAQTLSNHVAAVSSYLKTHSELKADVLDRVLAQKEKMIQRYNRKVRHQPLIPGQLVFLRQKNTGKLKPRWRGPFRVRAIGRHGVSYQIAQINNQPIKRTYHGDDLKLFKPREGYLAINDQNTWPEFQTVRHGRQGL